MADDELRQAVAEEAAPQAPAFEVILASNSPRRRELLNAAGVKFTVRTPVTPVDESLEPDLAANPEEAAKKLAERKAGAVIQEVLAENYTGMLIVIGADTMVVLDGKIFGKPRSASDGKHMLRRCPAAPTRSSRPCPSGWWPPPTPRTCLWASAPSPT